MGLGRRGGFLGAIALFNLSGVGLFGAAPKVRCGVYNVRTSQMQLPVVFQWGVVSLLTLPYPLDSLFRFYLK